MRNLLLSATLLLAAACGSTTVGSTTAGELPATTAAIVPVLVVADHAAAADWYVRTFGGQSSVVDGQSLLRFDDAAVLLVRPEPAAGRVAPGARGAGGSVHLYVRDVDAIVMAATAGGATVRMAPGDMFWGDRFAEIDDPFGHRWSFATHLEDVSEDEMARRLDLIGQAMASGAEMPTFPAPAARPASLVAPGYHRVTPALVVAGAADALAFYTGTLGFQEVSRMPMPDGRIMHAELELPGHPGWRVMVADEMTEMQGPAGPAADTWSFALQVPASAGAAATPGPDGTFTDPHGHRWQFVR